MRAVILAAGVGRRMENLDDDKGPLPKCLLTLDGKTLLERHVLNLRKCGINKLHLVLGYRRADVLEKIDEIVRKNAPLLDDFEVTNVYNDRFEEGSILSMLAASTVMEMEPCVLMDADVLYPWKLLDKLVRSRHKNCFLLDEAAGASDEEMRLGANGDRVLTIKRGLPGGYEVIGEGVGFLKLAPESGRVLIRETRKLVDEGIIGDYEEAIDAFLKLEPTGFEKVDYPWMEIDFAEDVKRAAGEVLPRVREVE